MSGYDILGGARPLPIDAADRERLIRELKDRYKTQLEEYAKLRQTHAKIFADYARYMADYPYTVARADAIRQKRAAKASAPKRRSRRSAPPAPPPPPPALPPPPPPPPPAPPAPPRRRIAPTLVAPPSAPDADLPVEDIVISTRRKRRGSMPAPLMQRLARVRPARSGGLDPNVEKAFAERYGEKTWKKMSAKDKRALIELGDSLALRLQADRRRMQGTLGVKRKK